MSGPGGCPGGQAVGWVIGESTPLQSLVLFDRSHVPHVGEYVLAQSPQGCVLGVVERVAVGNRILDDRVVDDREVRQALGFPDVRQDIYRRGVVRWLSLVDPLVSRGAALSPSSPVDPASEVLMAPSQLLRTVFSGQGRPGWVKLGSLARNPQVEFAIDVRKLTRHLAILAVTGGGKSNTVSILSHRIVSGLHGTVVIFDMHGEYAMAADSLAPGRAVVKEPRINPMTLSLSELLKLMRIGEKAHVQERIVRLSWKQVQDGIKRGTLKPSEVLNELRKVAPNHAPRERKDSLWGVLNKLDDLEDRYGEVLDPYYHVDLTRIVEPGRLNIFDLSSVDEIGADAVVSHYLRRLLEERKRWKITGGGEGYPVSVIVVIEEAHVLIPSEEDTLTKYWAGRVAREGRKFGLGLVLVSQRPKRVDSDVLSQTNNKIILRIVEPSDQRYVQAASEQLSEDLMQLLPSLNPGEAVVIGSMTRLPALVKIDLCSSICGAPTGGADIDIVEEWRRYEESQDEEVELQGLV